jgi:hypothetical protein
MDAVKRRAPQTCSMDRPVGKQKVDKSARRPSRYPSRPRAPEAGRGESGVSPPERTTNTRSSGEKHRNPVLSQVTTAIRPSASMDMIFKLCPSSLTRPLPPYPLLITCRVCMLVLSCVLSGIGTSIYRTLHALNGDDYQIPDIHPPPLSSYPVLR